MNVNVVTLTLLPRKCMVLNSLVKCCVLHNGVQHLRSC